MHTHTHFLHKYVHDITDTHTHTHTHQRSPPSTNDLTVCFPVSVCLGVILTLAELDREDKEEHTIEVRPLVNP